MVYVGVKSPAWKGGVSKNKKTCLICAKEFVSRDAEAKMCSRKCKGEYATKNSTHQRGNNGMWKGGVTGGNGNYIFVLRPEHPMSNKYGYVLEHRKLMSDHMGRILENHEIVHHINGKKDDNRMKNLMLMTKREHDGMHLKEYRDKRLNLRKKGKTLTALNKY